MNGIKLRFCESIYPVPSSEVGMESLKWSSSGCLCSVLFAVYMEGNNRDDIKFENRESDFPSPVTKPALPCCFDYSITPWIL